MAKIKSFTDLQQSKKLTEILSLESADMHYCLEQRDFASGYEIGITPYIKAKSFIGKCNIIDVRPSWSLASLLDVLPSRLFDSTPKRKELYLLPDLDKSYCFYRQFAVKTKGKIYLLTEGECLVDACVKMVIKLHELNLL